jgi:hypothetical protein
MSSLRLSSFLSLFLGPCCTFYNCLLSFAVHSLSRLIFWFLYSPILVSGLAVARLICPGDLCSYRAIVNRMSRVYVFADEVM